ncbi:MAG: hypothetical protein MJ133_01895 [Lachnospiraceae bacterium]|nr:hypothetical protein [Lachnospiraceae bacterium]
MNEYLVRDLSDFFEDCPENSAFLVIYEVQPIPDRTIKRVKISDNRIIDTIYPTDKEPQVIIRDFETGKISIHDVRICRGIYRLDEVVYDELYWFEPVPNYIYNEVKNTSFNGNVKKLVCSDKDLIVFSQNQINIKLTDRLLEDTHIYVKSVSISGNIAKANDSLIEKSITGENVSMGDFLGYLDDLEEGQNISIDFSSVHFYISGSVFYISKKIGHEENVNESFDCRFSVRRIGMPSLVFAKLIHAENDNSLLKVLNDFINK